MRSDTIRYGLRTLTRKEDKVCNATEVGFFMAEPAKQETSPRAPVLQADHGRVMLMSNKNVGCLLTYLPYFFRCSLHDTM